LRYDPHCVGLAFRPIINASCDRGPLLPPPRITKRQRTIATQTATARTSWRKSCRRRRTRARARMTIASVISSLVRAACSLLVRGGRRTLLPAPCRSCRPRSTWSCRIRARSWSWGWCVELVRFKQHPI
jgi:hypothetical protein